METGSLKLLGFVSFFLPSICLESYFHSITSFKLYMRKYCKQFLCDAAFWCQHFFIFNCGLVRLLSLMSMLPSIDDSRNVSMDIG